MSTIETLGYDPYEEGELGFAWDRVLLSSISIEEARLQYKKQAEDLGISNTQLKDLIEGVCANFETRMPESPSEWSWMLNHISYLNRAGVL